MCGIAGIIYQNSEVSIDTIKRFTDAMAHRGPDGGGYCLLHNNKLALGHRRLSIIDLTDNGKQPMHWKNRYTITFNGEVYNFIEIRKELEEKGIQFNSDSDTEVVLAAYHVWGFKCFEKFNGMWAIALYDLETKKLLLCRDRFGVKPLYYTLKPNNLFAFASETIAFKSLDEFAFTHNDELILSSINDPVSIEGTGYTIWQGVFQVLPGHCMELHVDQPEIKQKRWYSIPLQKSVLSYHEAKEEFFDLFQKAVKLRLRSDVPVATALSGGVDSSSVYAMLYHLKSLNICDERVDYNKIKGFVATFEGTLQDETKYAKAVVDYCEGEAEFLKTDFESIISNIESSTKLFNDITTTPISVLGDVYKSMRSQNYAVSLDGHGVDEMLYGYRSLVGMGVTQAIFDIDLDYERDLTETLVNMFHVEFREEERKKLKAKSSQLKNALGLDSGLRKMIYILKQNIKNVIGRKADYYNPQLSNHKFHHLSDKPINMSNCDYAEKQLLLDFYYKNIPYNMRDFDRAAMQHGVEIRMPFMDYNLVNFIFSLPMNYKVGHGFTKRILRDSLKNILPEEVRLRTLKIGMGAPIHNWFNGQLNQYLKEIVNSQKFLQNNLWNGVELRKMVTENCIRKSWTASEAQKFWNILNAHIILS